MKIKGQSGFTVVEGLLIALVIAVVGLGGYYVYNSQKKTETGESSTSQNTTPQTQADEYAGWKTYTFPKEGLSFRYPPDWGLDTESQGQRSGVTIEEVHLESPKVRGTYYYSTPGGFEKVDSSEATYRIEIYVGSEDLHFHTQSTQKVVGESKIIVNGNRLKIVTGTSPDYVGDLYIGPEYNSTTRQVLEFPSKVGSTNNHVRVIGEFIESDWGSALITQADFDKSETVKSAIKILESITY